MVFENMAASTGGHFAFRSFLVKYPNRWRLQAISSRLVSLTSLLKHRFRAFTLALRNPIIVV